MTDLTKYGIVAGVIVAAAIVASRSKGGLSDKTEHEATNAAIRRNTKGLYKRQWSIYDYETGKKVGAISLPTYETFENHGFTDTDKKSVVKALKHKGLISDKAGLDRIHVDFDSKKIEIVDLKLDGNTPVYEIKLGK